MLAPTVVTEERWGKTPVAEPGKPNHGNRSPAVKGVRALLPDASRIPSKRTRIVGRTHLLVGGFIDEEGEGDTPTRIRRLTSRVSLCDQSDGDPVRAGQLFSRSLNTCLNSGRAFRG